MRKYLVFVLVVLLVGALATGALAKEGPTKPAGVVGLLYLWEKDAGWNIVPDGAWGKMRYNLSGSTFDFVFNGHGLDPTVGYTLIYYPDPWAAPKTCLGSGTADVMGDVHIMGSIDTGDLPSLTDLNHPSHDGTGTPPLTGAKIWLVLSSDVTCPSGPMAGWTPAEYLFEYDRIWFDDTDV